MAKRAEVVHQHSTLCTMDGHLAMLVRYKTEDLKEKISDRSFQYNLVVLDDTDLTSVTDLSSVICQWQIQDSGREGALILCRYKDPYLIPGNIFSQRCPTAKF